MLRSGRLKKKTNVGLEMGTDCLGIETRPSPDGIFERQFNLNHMLEAAIEVLPHDAYALLLLVNHDLYEDEEDDFCCGRAYGGSRVCVVSTSRYNPVLDNEIGLNLEHTWPNPHCLQYIRSMSGRKEIDAADHSKQHDVASAPLRMAADTVGKFRQSGQETGYCQVVRQDLSDGQSRTRPLFWHGSLRLLRMCYARHDFSGRGYQAAAVLASDRRRQTPILHWCLYGAASASHAYILQEAPRCRTLRRVCCMDQG